MEINELRSQIDSIDDELVKLFCQRMKVAEQIAEYKRQNNLPILVPAREREKLQDVSSKAGSEMANYTRVLYSMIFELSRGYQSKCNLVTGELHQRIADSHAIPPDPTGGLPGRGGRLLPNCLRKDLQKPHDHVFQKL